MENLKKDALEAHNINRGKHGAPPLEWSAKLAERAQKWADELAKKNCLMHASQKEEGENIACAKGQELTGGKATKMWYDEIKDYDFSKSGFNSKTGHFTQVVWVESRELGVGKATAANGMQFVVARYFPPGNMVRSFPENVKNLGSKDVKRSGDGKPRCQADAGIGNGHRGAVGESTKPKSMKDFENDILEAHNDNRSKHGTPALAWSTKLAKKAQEWADELAKKNCLMHASQDEEGENVACAQGQELTGGKATKMWYDEIKDYDFSKSGFTSKTGHFTQVVWVDSRELGAGKATAANGMQFVVARYFPPGNMLGSFPGNVKKPGSKGVSRSTNAKPSSQADANGGVSAQSENSGEFRDEILQSHNHYRKLHGSPALKWSDRLAAEAQKAVYQSSKTNSLKAVDMKNVGQNMAAMIGGNLSGRKVTDMWYQEEKEYNYDSPGFSSKTGHYTGMIWSDTTHIGAARSYGKGGKQFVHAIYEPPGNIRGQFEQNVKQSSG